MGRLHIIHLILSLSRESEVIFKVKLRTFLSLDGSCSYPSRQLHNSVHLSSYNSQTLENKIICNTNIKACVLSGENTCQAQRRTFHTWETPVRVVVDLCRISHSKLHASMALYFFAGMFEQKVINWGVGLC